MTPFPRQPALASHPPFALLATPAHTASVSVTHGWSADSLYKPETPALPTHARAHFSSNLFYMGKRLWDAHAQTYVTLGKCAMAFI